MAKLSKANLAAQISTPASKVEEWNPPIATSVASPAALMLPPKSRPLPKTPSTPSQNIAANSIDSGRQDSSSKKKRRRRGGKRNRDSASEVTTNLSEDVTKDAVTSTSQAPEVLVPASQSSISALPPNASAEEIRIFENEPEMYGVYASSDEGEETGNIEEHDATVPRKLRAPAYSPSIATGLPRSSPARQLQEESEESATEETTKSDFKSDVASVREDQIPELEKLADGRFKCPLAAEYDCSATFAQSKGARRHVARHLDAEKFKCNECGKKYSRRDTFGRHLKSAHDLKVSDVLMGKEKSDRVQSSGVVHRQRRRLVQQGTGSVSGSPDSENVDIASACREKRLEVDVAPPFENKSTGSSPQNITTQNRASVKASSKTNRSPVATKDESFRTNGNLKRQRQSSQPSSEIKSRSRKRLRRDGNAVSSKLQHTNVSPSATPTSDPSTGPTVEESENLDVEMSNADGHQEEVRSQSEDAAQSVEDEKNVDVDMINRDAAEAFDRDSTSHPEETTSIEENDDDDNTSSRHPAEAEQEEEETEEDEDIEEEEITEEEEAATIVVPSEPSKLAKSHARTPEEAKSRVQRQSSMDSFVHRSRSTTTSTRASGSSSRITVNVPVRSKSQTKIVPHVQVSASQSTRRKDKHLAESDIEEESTKDDKKVVRRSGKGKERARSAEPDEETIDQEMQEQTSSDDQPKATTVARRTSSVTSRGKPGTKKKGSARKTTKKGVDRRLSEDTERPKPKPKARSRSRKTSKKKAGNATTDESSGEQSSPKAKTSTSIANSTWKEASTSGVTGKFTEKEIRILHAWRDSFCAENSMTAYEFNEMMANTASINKSDWRYGNWITKTDFMQQFYEQLPYRNRRSMIRFRERQFQNVDSSPWTKEQDDELRQLVSELGSKWVEIAQLMGRTQDAVSQRWRHKLNYGEKPALMGDWTEEEVKKLEEQVVAYAQLKKTTPNDDNLQIPWIAISKKLGNGRTAQQCSNRWRLNTSRRVGGKFVKVPHNDRIPGEKVQKPRTPSKMEQRLSGKWSIKQSKSYMSAERVEDSEEEVEGGEEGAQQEAEKESDMDEDDDADDESEDAAVDEKQDADDVEMKDEASDGEVDSRNASDEDERQQDEFKDVPSAEDGNTSGSEADEMTSESEREAPSQDELPATIPIRDLGHTDSKREQSVEREEGVSRGISSSQPTHRSRFDNPQSQSSTTATQTLPSSLPTAFKTPAISRNPLRRSDRDVDTPGNGLSLTQLHAGTQANSSAKRTTGRTNRTRIPDSAIVENRPSPQLDLRRRPARSSSPSMTPIADIAHGLAEDEDEDEEEQTETESNSDGSIDEHERTDLKSPSTFVSARDDAGRSDNESEEEYTRSEEDSDSDLVEDSDSDSDTHSDRQQAHDTQKIDRDSSSSFWQSVNQNFRKLTGQSQSQSQSQTRDQTQSQNRKGRLSLADVLRRGNAARIEDSGSDDDE